MSIIGLDLVAVRSRRLPRWRQITALLSEWRVRIRSRCELASLDDRELWDMGLTRMDADNEAEKPFWQG